MCMGVCVCALVCVCVIRAYVSMSAMKQNSLYMFVYVCEKSK